MFFKTKVSVLQLSLLSIVALATHAYNFAAHSIELISEGDTLVLSKKEAENLSKRLIQDPLTLLHELKTYAHKREKLDWSIDSFSREVTQKNIKTDREQNPIFLIGECDSDMCGLSRSQNSSRSFYEKTVVSYLKKHKDQQRINYVSFASGGLFQELIILAQAACVQDIKNINIHLVDPVYGVLIQALKTITKQSSPINISYYNNFNFHDYSATREHEISTQKRCEQYLIFKQEMFRQFVSTVKQLSDNNVRVFIHQSVDAYHEFCTQHPEMKADLISAMDLEPEIGYETAIKDYYKLIYHTLKKGGTAILADSNFGPKKLNYIDHVVHAVPNVACWAVHLFYETMWKHCVNLKPATIYGPLRYLDRYNKAFVCIHSKQAECTEEFLRNLESTLTVRYNNWSKLNHALQRLDNNEFITCSNQFDGISATKKVVCAGMVLGGICIAKRLKY